MAFCKLLAAACLLGLGWGFDEAVLLQDVEIRSHVDEPKKETNSALRSLLKASPMPGLAGASLPEGMPEIDIGEVMSLSDLLPPLVKSVTDELPKIADAARVMEAAAMRGAAALEAADAGSHDILREHIVKLVTDYKAAWVPFATSLVAGLNHTLVPIIERAQKRVGFIPANASTELVGTVTALLSSTAMSGLAQIPVQRDLRRISRTAFQHWNKTNNTMTTIKELLGQEIDFGMLSMLPTPGVNLTEALLRQRADGWAIVRAVDGANNNVSFAIRNVTEKAGVFWRTEPAAPEEQEESGSTSVRAGFAFVLAGALAMLRL